jgi:hypothetical protein
VGTECGFDSRRLHCSCRAKSGLCRCYTPTGIVPKGSNSRAVDLDAGRAFELANAALRLLHEVAPEDRLATLRAMERELERWEAQETPQQRRFQRQHRQRTLSTVTLAEAILRSPSR